MWLKTVRADRLRNLRGVGVDLARGLSLLTGRNGQGKTSFLEALYLLGTGFSFRTRRFEDLVGREGGPARVTGILERPRGTPTSLGIVIDEGARRLLVNGAEVDLENFLGRVDVVALAGEGHRVLRDAPEQRRRFLDSGIAAQKPSFLRALGAFRRTLAERNALLRSDRSGGFRSGEHGAWEERLAAAAAAVHRERRAFSVALASKLGDVERAVFPNQGSLVLRFLPSPPDVRRDSPERFETIYREALERSRVHDGTLGFTASGPHRDEFRVDLDGEDLRRFGSAGQVRAAMVALSLAKLALLTERRGESPVFLMDDFDSDLDEKRMHALVEFLHDGRFQAVLATAKEGWAAGQAAPFLKIRMDGGEAAAF